MKAILSSIFIGCSLLGMSQSFSVENLDLALAVSPGYTRGTVVDKTDESSRDNLISDGKTSVDEKALRGGSFKLMANYHFNENVSLSSGLYFSKKRLNIKNTDGSYVGTSVYHASYVHLPILLGYRRENVIEKLHVVALLGPTIDFKSKEENIGADYAHFMNFANNRFDTDARSQNGNNEAENLMRNVGVSLQLNLGAEYDFTDKIYGLASFSCQPRISNMLGSVLSYNDSEETKIAKTMKWRNTLWTIDLGVGYRF